ncbi:hypothetical protein O9992_18070 [Vibrio lentus]|nr:hypothetical protein [Vibrio lentus]
MLGLKDFKPRTIDEFTAPLHEMDEEGALSYFQSMLAKLYVCWRLMAT